MIKTFYKGRLPHVQPIGATFFVTFHLNGVIPIPAIQKYKQAYDDAVFHLEASTTDNIDEQLYNLQKIFFQKYDDLLMQQKDAPQHLKHPKIQEILNQQLLRFDQIWYNTLAFSIMPNHCHWVVDFSQQLLHLDPSEPITIANYKPLYAAMKQIKGATARYSNEVLGKKGQFFYHESYDHYVRDDKELFNTIRYTLQNPVKAGLTEHWEDWSGNYCSREIHFPPSRIGGK
jgi:putative transposase